MINITITPNANHLMFKECTFNEHGVALDEKIAFKSIDKTKAATALAWAKTQKWEFTGEPVNGNTYEITLVNANEQVTPPVEEKVV